MLQKLPKSSAAGPSGWTYEQLMSSMLHDDSAFEGGLWFVNAQLAGTLPHCPNLLASRLIPISKQSTEQLLMQPAGAVPDVRPLQLVRSGADMQDSALLLRSPLFGSHCSPSSSESACAVALRLLATWFVHAVPSQRC